MANENTKNFIDQLSQGKNDEAGEAFKAALRDKVADSLDNARKDLASNMFKVPTEAEDFSDPKPEIADIEYFRSKLYRSLNVPVSRLEGSTGFNLGRASEITRDELKFTKFVQRLRKKFTELFNDLLRTQLILKGIINEDDWFSVRDALNYDFIQDGHFAELKNTEMARERLQLANEMRDYIGKFYSLRYVRKNVLKQNEKEIEDMDNQIKQEIKDGLIDSPTSQTSDME